jgi:protein TonB
MMTLLTILVVLLHLWLFLWLTQSNDITTPAQPQVMAVSMITIAAPKPAVAAPQPAPPPPESKPLPKKTPPKPVEKKPPPVVQKAPDFAPSEPVSDPQPATQPTTNSAPVAAAENKASSKATEQPSDATCHINYAHNPKPEYPAIARSRGWTGSVKLKVRVSAGGLSESIEVIESSGHDILDDKAVEAVKEWRFVRSNCPEPPTTNLVTVPVSFNLRNN